MKIVTEEFEALFKDYPLYSQEEAEDPLVIAKLFDPCGNATWFLTEYYPVEKTAANNAAFMIKETAYTMISFFVVFVVIFEIKICEICPKMTNKYHTLI
jgi:hypothetical protein